MQAESRPWGSFTVGCDATGFKIKTLNILPNRRISLQRHERRAEHWFVVSGTGVAYLDAGDGGEIINLVAGSSVDIPIYAVHRLEAYADGLTVVEIQTGKSFSEDDIIRLSDDYGRQIFSKDSVNE
jgi:mannose-6-phosphate isomerase-like protein (cupin superfamily)